jgi:hypothetical protein
MSNTQKDWKPTRLDVSDEELEEHALRAAKLFRWSLGIFFESEPEIEHIVENQETRELAMCMSNVFVNHLWEEMWEGVSNRPHETIARLLGYGMAIQRIYEKGDSASLHKLQKELLAMPHSLDETLSVMTKIGKEIGAEGMKHFFERPAVKEIYDKIDEDIAKHDGV